MAITIDKNADAVKVKYTTDDFIGHVKVTISAKEVRVWVCDENGCQFRFKAMGKVVKSGGMDVMVVTENNSHDALVKACEEMVECSSHTDCTQCPINCDGQSNEPIAKAKAALELAKKGA